MINTDTRRFKVKADAFYVRHEDGVWLRNNIGSFTIRGGGAYDLVAAVFARLDGTCTVGDLCAGLSDGAAGSVTKLVETLAGNGFVRAVEAEPELVPGWMRTRYATHLAFLEHHGDRPVSRLLRVRSQLVAVAGDGVALRGVVGALADFGIAKVAVLTPDRTIAQTVRDAAARDPQFQWETIESAFQLDELTRVPKFRDARWALLATDRGDAAEIAELQAGLRAAGKSVGVLGGCGDFVAATPASPDDSWCWECLHRNIAARAVGDSGPAALAPAPATIGALHLVQRLFAELAELATGAGSVVTAEPFAPVVRTHTGRKHPLCGRHIRMTAARPVDVAALRGEPVRLDIPAADDPVELIGVSDRIVEVTTRWTDSITGPLYSVGEADAGQLPLSSSSCTVADPDSTAAHPSTKEIHCQAISAREARNQAVLYALEWQASRIAELTDHPARGWVFGAGWSAAEAWYRVGVASAYAEPPGSLDWQSVSGEQHPVRDYLLETLADIGKPPNSAAYEHVSNGLVRAWVRGADIEATAGVGLDPDHALRNALLRAVAENGSTVAHLAPPVADWQEAAIMLTGHPGVLDVSELLPFLGADGYLFAAAAPGVTS
ncbi:MULTISPECIES: hypothetical protein [unclassified Nocardia]|uniref:hypothetical protein n=1 Tax=unclassified Nocardia TaxID=2637762 RepID=UPI001CE3BDB6|nr:MULTISPECIES: hypothetical protein [unclassified Nocardia]